MQKSLVHLELLAFEIAGKHGVTFADLAGVRRTAPICKARAEFAYEAHAKGYSYPQMGTLLHKDHSSMILAERRWQKHLKEIRSCSPVSCSQS